MDFLFLLTTIALMFAGGHGYSQSMSCSTVNGKTICEKQTSEGNVAGAFAGSAFGKNGAYQDVSAMTGDTWTGQSQSSRTSRDPLRGFGVPNFNPSQSVNQYRHPGRIHGPNHFIGTGVSDVTSFNSPTGNIGISGSGFSGSRNNNGIPGPAFGGFAVADSSGDRFYGAGNTHGGGLAHGNGNPGAFDPSAIFGSLGLGGPGFPFNIFGRKR